jgi:hypothetical protein
VPVAALRALPWAARGPPAAATSAAGWRSLRTGVVTALLLGVFGALLASADAAFARLVELALPDAAARASCPPGWCSAASSPRWCSGVATSPSPRRPGRGCSCRRRAALAGPSGLVPVGALDLLLLAFLAVPLHRAVRRSATTCCGPPA